MATYKEIKGTQIEVLASDPSNPVEGQVWYNSTSSVLKGHTLTGAGSWSTGGTLNTARWIYTHGAGTQTAGLVYGGEDGLNKAQTEAYNGTSWTEVNDLNTAGKAMGGGGAYTSALTAGGSGRISSSESWNGTSWSNTPSLNTAREYLGGGNQSSTAGVVFGGFVPPGTTARAFTESWNGSAWTEVADLNTARRSNAGTGTSTLALCGGGYVTGNVANVETWNGSSWTEVADQNVAGGGAMFGIQSSAVKKSGGLNIELWNGTSWSTGTSTSNDLGNRSGLGTSSLGLLAGGESPYSTATEEYLGPGVAVTRTFTDS